MNLLLPHNVVSAGGGQPLAVANATLRFSLPDYAPRVHPSPQLRASGGHQSEPVMKKAAMNILVRVFCGPVYSFLIVILRNAIVGS